MFYYYRMNLLQALLVKADDVSSLLQTMVYAGFAYQLPFLTTYTYSTRASVIP